jgi:hypothetical protein
MPLTLSPAGGDGVLSPAIRCNVLLPDSGTTITVNGSYQPPLVGSVPQGMQPIINFSGTVTSPGVPGSGSNFWNCLLNVTTGALTVQNSTVAFQQPTAGTIVLFQQQIASTASSDPALQGSLTFPWL